LKNPPGALISKSAFPEISRKADLEGAVEKSINNHFLQGLPAYALPEAAFMLVRKRAYAGSPCKTGFFNSPETSAFPVLPQSLYNHIW